MVGRESIERDERGAFRLYLRTGRRAGTIANRLETKFNPNHDPNDGRFTSGLGGAAALRSAAVHGGRRGPRRQEGAENHVVKLDPLSAADVATVHRIAATPSIVRAMDRAWDESQKDGRERGFFIYRDGQRYFVEETVVGEKDSLPGLYGKLVRPNALRGDFRQVSAWFHTHPGVHKNADQADNYDQGFGEYVGGITTIKTRSGFVVGR
jgi:hypothetical protein